MPLFASLLQTRPDDAAGEPDWLREVRAAALADLRGVGLPTPRVESWKYTPLRALESRRFVCCSDAEASRRAVPEAALALVAADAPRLVFVNGTYRADLTRLQGLPAGLTLEPLSAALAQAPEAMRFLLARRFAAAGDVFARLNTALLREGTLLRVAPGTRIVPPVHLVCVGTPAEADIAWSLRHLIDLGEDSHLTLVEHYVGSGAHAHLGNGLAQYRLQAGAVLRIVQAQEEAVGASLIRRSEFDLDARAEVMLTALDLGATLARHDLVARLSGAGARFSARGCFALRGRQHADMQIDVGHRACDSACELIWRGVADERARGVLRGAIGIEPGADGAVAHLSTKNLLLSPHAEIDAQPVLEIHADEVQASHGATVGQLDEAALFYLRSRGLSAAAARALLIQAFCREVLDAGVPEALRDALAARLAHCLPQEARNA